MRYAKSTALLMGLLATLVLSSSAVLALQVDATVDKNVVTFGDTIVVSGSITDDEGNPGSFDYRVAAIVAGKGHGGERVVICDSGRQTSGEDGTVSFDCKIPTVEEMQALGVENADVRAAIPLKGGIAAFDPDTNKTAKKSGKALIVNREKLEDRLENASTRIDHFIAKAEEAIARCDNITARAEEAGAERVIERCGQFQEKMREQIERALASQERINEALSNVGNLSGVDFDMFHRGLNDFREGSKMFRGEVGEVRDFVDKARADLERKVAKEIKDRAMERAKEIREQALEKERMLKDRIQELRRDKMEIREARPAAIGMPVPGSDATEMEVESDDSDDNSGSGSDDSGTEEVSGNSGSG